MATSDWREQLPQKVRNMQIIVGAMFLGCFCLLIIAVLVAKGRNNSADLTLTYAALAYAGIILVPWIILPAIVVSRGRKEIRRRLFSAAEPVRDNTINDKTEKETSKALALMGLFQTKTIIAGAMLEGSAFFLLIVYIIEHSPLSLLAAIVLMILLVAQMPTTGGVTNWIEDQMRLVDQERAF